MLQNLSSVLSEDQLQQVLDLLMRLKERAIDRGCEQSLTIVINDKGLPRHINGTDNVRATVPKIYKSE